MTSEELIVTGSLQVTLPQKKTKMKKSRFRGGLNSEPLSSSVGKALMLSAKSEVARLHISLGFFTLSSVCVYFYFLLYSTFEDDIQLICLLFVNQGLSQDPNSLSNLDQVRYRLSNYI